jgi:parallel beta-helix repeat protein
VFDNVLTNEKHARSGGWPQAIGVYKSERVAVSGNRVFRNHGEGIAFIVSDRCTASENEVFDNFSVGIYLDNAQWATVERNLVYSTGDQRFFRFGMPAFGIGTANEQYDVANSLQYLTIVNNIIVRTRSAIYYGNYDRGGGLRNAIIANNTCYQSSEALLRINRSSRHRQTLIANNIFVQPNAVNALADVVTNGIAFTSNAWNRENRGAAKGEGDVVGDVKLANPGGTKPSDYRIAAGSPCIDAGTPIESLTNDYFEKPRSQKPDIGAIEL